MNTKIVNFLIKSMPWFAAISIIGGLIFFFVAISKFATIYDVYKDTNASFLDMPGTGQIGDIIGGILGPIWSLTGIFLFYLTLNLQKDDLLAARKEFQINRITTIVYQQLERADSLIVDFEYKSKQGRRGLLYLHSDLENIGMATQLHDHNTELLIDNRAKYARNMAILVGSQIEIYDLFYGIQNNVLALDAILNSVSLTKPEIEEFKTLYFNNLGFYFIELNTKLFSTIDSYLYWKNNGGNIISYDLDIPGKIFLNCQVIFDFMAGIKRPSITAVPVV